MKLPEYNDENSIVVTLIYKSGKNSVNLNCSDYHYEVFGFCYTISSNKEDIEDVEHVIPWSELEEVIVI
jgi:hypothetical protein